MTTDFDNLTPEEQFDLDRQATMACVKTIIAQLESFNEQFLSANVAYPGIILEPALKQIGLHSWELVKQHDDAFYGVPSK